VNLPQVLLMAQGGTLALLALWSWLLWRDHRDTLAAWIAIAMNLGIASYVLISGGFHESATLHGLLIGTLARSTPASAWLFARIWFNDRTGLSRGEMLIVALYVLVSLVLHFSWQTVPLLFFASSALFRLGMFGFALAVLWEAWRGREGDLIEPRRRLRLALVCVVGLYVLAIAVAEIAVFDGDAPLLIIPLIGASTAFSTLAFCAAMFASRRADLFGVSTDTAAEPPLLAADDPLAGRLLSLMQQDKPHRDEGLTIAALAQRLGEQEYRLRRMINGGMGYRNFAQFLNAHRLAEVKAALADPAQREVSILTIALDAGFGSLGPFNRAFREAEGMTPSEFRARALADSEIG
jgi:AraC-like DNA-binding protein